MRVPAERLLHLQRQSVHAAPHNGVDCDRISLPRHLDEPEKSRPMGRESGECRLASPSYSGCWRRRSAEMVGCAVARYVCFTAGFGLWVGAGGFSRRVSGAIRGPVAYGPAGIMAAAMWRIKQAAAKARRTREAISTTRAPSFKSRRRMVLNSAVASACALGIASRTVSMSQ